MIGILVPLGFLTLVTGLISHSVGGLVATLVAWLTSLLLHIVHWFVHFQRWSYRIPGPPSWLIVLFFMIGVAIAAEIRFRQASRRMIGRGLCLGWALCALTIAIFPFRADWAKGKLEVNVLDVGQGDSLFVVPPNSTTLEFLAAVQPRVAIISVGEKNTYGHPSSELLERLEAAGVRILRTDRDGAVQVLNDGERLEISCFVACPEARATAASVRADPADGKQDSQKQ
jgi:beta-lactamase superfamily II metal-dependent hydrolase